MRTTTLTALAVACLATSNLAGAAERKNLQVLNDVSKQVTTYSWFTIFDDVSASIDGDVVTLTVDEWYQGGDADVVTITAPLGMEALIGGIAFEPGQPYLVSAYDGVVSYCGMSGPATPELQQMYDDAFAR